jgi:hypothetical protein
VGAQPFPESAHPESYPAKLIRHFGCLVPEKRCALLELQGRVNSEGAAICDI